MSPVVAALAKLALVGLTAGGLAALARALPWPKSWKRRKPLGCAACCGGHAAWIVMLVGWLLGDLALEGLGEVLVIYFGATGIAAVVNAVAIPSDSLTDVLD